MPKPDKPPGQGKPQPKTTVTATLHNLPDTCAITGKVGINATLNLQEARDTCAITGRNLVSARLPIVEARDTCLIQGNITFKTTAVLTPVEARDTCSISGNIVSGGTDWDTRKNAAGVFRYFSFDDNAQLGGGPQSNFGVTVGTVSSPVIDTTVYAPGGPLGSLRFDVPSNVGANPSGSWFANFSANLGLQFGANSEFYFQVRVRWNSVMASQYFLNIDGTSPQSGIKFFDVNAGDQLGGFSPTGDGITHFYSSSDIKVVTQTYYQQKLPILYHYFPTAGNGVALMVETIAGPDYLLENEMPAPQCLYSRAIASSQNGPVTGCFTMPANEWVTFKQWVKLGNLGDDGAGNPVWLNSEVKMWIAREGMQSQLVHWWRPGIGGYQPLIAGPTIEAQKFGKVWLFPYMTERDPNQTTQGLGQVWYGQLILSTQDIADPVTNFPGLAANTVQDLGSFTCTEAGGGLTCKNVNEFSGMTYDPNRNQMVVFGGGHKSTDYDALDCFALGRNTWVGEYQPTPFNNQLVSRYDYNLGAWTSGGPGSSGPYPRPAARHTEDLFVVAGDELIMLTMVEGNTDQLGALNGASGDPSLFLIAPNSKICHYNFITKTWAFTSTVCTSSNEYPAAAYDPISGKVIILGQTDGLRFYDPVTHAMTLVSGVTYRDENGNPLDPGLLQYNNNLVYCSTDQNLYYFARGTPTAVWRVVLNRSSGTFANSTVTRLTTTGTAVDTAFASEPGYAFDSQNGLFGSGPFNVSGQMKFFVFNPTTKVWSSQVINGTVPNPLSWHAIGYSPADNVYIFIDAPAGLPANHTWAYRWA